MKYKVKSYSLSGEFTESAHETLLEAMREQRIFSVDKSAYGFTFEECCDGNFSVTLTPEQLAALAAELLELLRAPAPPA